MTNTNDNIKNDFEGKELSLERMPRSTSSSDNGSKRGGTFLAVLVVGLVLLTLAMFATVSFSKSSTNVRTARASRASLTWWHGQEGDEFDWKVLDQINDDDDTEDEEQVHEDESITVSWEAMASISRNLQETCQDMPSWIQPGTNRVRTCRYVQRKPVQRCRQYGQFCPSMCDLCTPPPPPNTPNPPPSSTPPDLKLTGKCTDARTCGLCEGDCGRDSHCDPGLVCYIRDSGTVGATVPVPGCNTNPRWLYAKDFCVDSKIYQCEDDKSTNCAWVARNLQSRCINYGYLCRETCGYCRPRN